MKIIYHNGIGTSVDVLDRNKKRMKDVGTAKLADVFSAKKEGDLRVFTMCSGKKAGIKESLWDEFMSIHDSEETRIRIEQAAPLIWP